MKPFGTTISATVMIRGVKCAIPGCCRLRERDDRLCWYCRRLIRPMDRLPVHPVVPEHHRRRWESDTVNVLCGYVGRASRN